MLHRSEEKILAGLLFVRRKSGRQHPLRSDFRTALPRGSDSILAAALTK
jgi:hypothetical protein